MQYSRVGWKIWNGKPSGIIILDQIRQPNLKAFKYASQYFCEDYSRDVLRKKMKQNQGTSFTDVVYP